MGGSDQEQSGVISIVDRALEAQAPGMPKSVPHVALLFSLLYLTASWPFVPGCPRGT